MLWILYYPLLPYISLDLANFKFVAICPRKTILILFSAYAPTSASALASASAPKTVSATSTTIASVPSVSCAVAYP